MSPLRRQYRRCAEATAMSAGGPWQGCQLTRRDIFEFFWQTKRGLEYAAFYARIQTVRYVAKLSQPLNFQAILHRPWLRRIYAPLFYGSVVIKVLIGGDICTGWSRPLLPRLQ